jgi:hypothetical protein
MTRRSRRGGYCGDGGCLPCWGRVIAPRRHQDTKRRRVAILMDRDRRAGGAMNRGARERRGPALVSEREAGASGRALGLTRVSLLPPRLGLVGVGGPGTQGLAPPGYTPTPFQGCGSGPGAPGCALRAEKKVYHQGSKAQESSAKADYGVCIIETLPPETGGASAGDHREATPRTGRVIRTFRQTIIVTPPIRANPDGWATRPRRRRRRS